MDNDRVDRSPPKRPLEDEEQDCSDRRTKKLAPPSPNKESSSFHGGAYGDLEREIELLPNQDTAALRQAFKRAPELVLLESDPSSFLELHEGDAKEAAKRLSCYWKTRVEVFGDDKAFLPLSLPGKYGLFSPEHWQELKCDTIVPLPDDAKGNTVLFVDRSRQICPPDLKIRLQVAFYLLCQCCQTKGKKESSGIVLLFRVSACTTFYSLVNDRLLQWINEAFPVRLKHVHLAGCPPAKPGRRIFENCIMHSAVQALKNHHAEPLTAHIGMKKEDLLDKLMPFGFQEQGLPEVMGGNWDYQVFHAWVQGRHEGTSDEGDGTQESKTDVDDDTEENPLQQGAQQPPTEREESSQPPVQGLRQSTPTELEDSKPSATIATGISATQFSTASVPQAAPKRGESSSSSASSSDDDVAEEEEEDRKLPARRTGLLQPATLAQVTQEPHTIVPAVESLLAMASAASPLGVAGMAASADQQDAGSLQAWMQANQQLQQEIAIARLTSDPRLNLYASASATQMAHGDAAFTRPEDKLRPGTGQLLGLLSSSINASPAQTRQTTQDRILEPSLLVQTAGSTAVSNAMKLMPVASKKAYLEALQYCPRLVEMESDPQKFLKCTDYDVMAAAQRLASYWEYRKQLFGSRAFAPLIQSGNGALTLEDVVLLSSGAIATLPPDDSGCSVVCLDRSRLLGRQAATANDRLRAAFYLASKLTEFDKNMTEGIVLICVLVTPRVLEIDNDMTVGLLELGRTAFPLKVKHIHLSACPPKTGKKATVDNMISSQLKLIMGGFKGNASLHIAETPDAILEKLRPFGFREDALPPSVGGSWKYEEFNRFLRQQSEREQRLESTLLTMSAKPPTRGNEGEKVDRRERKRLLNIIHSRQKRERRQAEMERMSEERDALEAKNKRLRSANGKLESLIKEAEKMVAKIEKGETIPLSTAASLPLYGASGSTTPLREHGLPTASQGATATGDMGLYISSMLERAASGRMIQPPTFETARFNTMQQQPEPSRPFAPQQIDTRLLSLQRQPPPQDSQSELLAHLWGDPRARAVASGLPTGLSATSLPSYEDPSLNPPVRTLQQSAFLSELEQLMQGATPASRSHLNDLQQLLLNRERASLQVSDARLLELMLQQQQQQEARNQAAASIAGTSAFLPTSSQPQVPVPLQSLQSLNEHLVLWNQLLSGASFALNAPPVEAATAAAAAPPAALNVDPQVLTFLQALQRQQQGQQQQQQQHQQQPPQQQPPPPHDPTNPPFYRRSF